MNTGAGAAPEPLPINAGGMIRLRPSWATSRGSVATLVWVSCVPLSCGPLVVLVWPFSSDGVCVVEETRVTDKLEVGGTVAESSIGEVVALVTPLADTMLMEAICQSGLSIGPVCPPMVADAPVMLAVPNVASGKMPLLDEGASTIHSAL